MRSRTIEVALLACAFVLALTVGAPGATAATIVVNDSSDALHDPGCAVSGTGTCTLRDAMTFANAEPNSWPPDQIHFALAGSGVHTITLDADLPTAIQPQTIDGYTQPGSSANTNGPGLPDNAVLLIEIDGNGKECFALGGGNTVRGLVINRCKGYGVSFLAENGQFVVDGNFIGTDPTGKLSRANAGGVSVREGGPYRLYTVGGATPAARNVISGNSGAGVVVAGATVVIQGNFIGTDATGTAALANGGSGIELNRSSVDLSDNVVSGNAGRGVLLIESNANMYGNLIGTDASGTGPLGNRMAGVWITAPESLLAHSEIRGNTIAFNGSGDPVGGGVVNSLGVHPFGFSDPTIRGNSIFDNTSDGSLADRGLGIDLQGYGPTPNDPCNGTEENRRAQNFPVLTGAFASDSAIRVRGTLDSTAKMRFQIEFFASPACDPSGYGEGKTFLGGTEVTEDDSCNAAFDLSLPVSVSPGQYVTATATDASTSEFSPCILVVPAPLPVAAPVAIAVDPAAGAGSDGNGVFEPGETVTIKPSWKNVGTHAVTLDAAASKFSGPDQASSYSVVAGAAHYGTIAAGATADCGANCYSLSVANLSPRPSTHWDATVLETPATDDPPRVWTLHLGDSFQDVPRSHPYYKKIEALVHGGITAGCYSGPGQRYCPGNVVSRYELAAFIARGIAGGGASIPSSGTVNGKPYSCGTPGGTSIFSDVPPADDIFCKHVHYMAAQNVTLGCSATEFCPTATANRDSMAGFIAKAVVAPGGGPAVPLVYGPDPVTGRSYSCDLGSPSTHFTDVPPTDPFCKHVHFLWAKGIIDGCTADQYCPTESVTRETMAKFLVNAFQLKLYGP